MLTIITISYNSDNVLKQCLAPLIDSNEFPVVIVDNASTDGSAERLQDRFPTAELIALEQNIGYGRAANIGMEKVETPYALLLNPDLTASISDVKKLFTHTQNDQSTAIWAPASSPVDFTGEPPEAVEWVSGCAMLFDMEKIKNVGLFDENFFLFFEETDLCARTLGKGFSIKHCKDVYFDHMLGQACTPSPEIEYMKWWHFGWSRCYYFNKHGWSQKKRSPQRQFRQYHSKYFISARPAKRRKYKAQATGAKAFLRGEKAFLNDGTPQASPCSERPETDIT